jgi:hypothetical protein
VKIESTVGSSKDFPGVDTLELESDTRFGAAAALTVVEGYTQDASFILLDPAMLRELSAEAARLADELEARQ